MVIILRVNLDIKGTKKDESSVRFKAALESIHSLISPKNKLVIISHRGRPSYAKTSKGKPEGFDKKLSLKGICRLFEKALKKKITFFSHFDFTAIRQEIASAKPGTIFMLENIRFLPSEQKNDVQLAKDLASLGDLFVNDDFATAHRENASNVGITKFLPSRMGKVLKKEIEVLNKAVEKPKRPFVLIIGGAKMSDKMGVIDNLCNKVDSILLGGGPANTVLKAKGINIGNSIYEANMLEVGKAFACENKIVLPEDGNEKDNKILDIGSKAIKTFSSIIQKAKTVIWGGPMGMYELKGFEKGSYALARAIAKSKAFSIVGGGDTTEVITRLKLEKKINLLSTGGGAMLEYLAGKKLPALEALKRNT